MPSDKVVIHLEGGVVIRALKILIFGLFSGPILAELIGFISPFVMLRNEELGYQFQDSAYYIGAFSSVFFSVALLFAAFNTSKISYKIGSSVIALLYIISSCYVFLDSESRMETIIYGLNYLCSVASLTLGAFIALHCFKNTTHSVYKHA